MNKKNFIKYIISLLLFGSNGIVSHYIHLTSVEIVLLRTLIGGAFITLLFLLGNKKFTFYKYKKDFLFLFLSGISLGFGWLFLFEAYRQIGVSLGTLIYYFGPAIVMVTSPFVFKERLSLIKFLGFIVVLLGLYFINNNINSGTNVFGLICAFLSAFMYMMLIYSNRFIKNIKGLENIIFQMFFAFLVIIIFKVVVNGFFIDFKMNDLPYILYLCLINTGIGCYLYFTSISELPIQTVAICGYIDPMSALIFSSIFLKEKLSLIQIVGAIFIFSGVLFTELIEINSAKKNKNHT